MSPTNEATTPNVPAQPPVEAPVVPTEAQKPLGATAPSVRAAQQIDVETGVMADQAKTLRARYTYGIYVKAINSGDLFTISLVESNPALVLMRLREIIKSTVVEPQLYSFRIKSIEVLDQI